MSGDITAANRLYIANDASLNRKVFVKKNLNVTGKATIKNYSASATTYQVGYQFVEMSDVSLSGRLYAMNDVSLNGSLFMRSDASFGGRLFITGDLSAGGNIIGKTLTAPIMNIATDINMTSFSAPYVQQFGTVPAAFPPTPPIPTTKFVNLSNYAQYSGGNSILLNTLYSNSDSSFNSRTFITADASLNRRLFIGSDVSFNVRLYVGGDASFGSCLFIPLDASFNSRLFIQNYISLNARLFVKGDLSLNRNLSTTLIKSTGNSANTWVPIPGLTTNANWSSTSCSSTGQYMVATWSNNVVYISSSYGEGGTWNSIFSLPGSNIAWTSSSISATGQYMFITTNGGGSYVSAGYGVNNTWAQVPTTVLPTTANFINSAISGTGQYMLTADNNSGSVYLSVGYGASGSWGAIPGPILPINTAWRGVAMNSTGQYMAAGIIAGSLYLSSNYGQSWNIVTGISSGSWQNISFSSTGQYIIVGNNAAGFLFISADFGNTWTAAPGLPTNSNWYNVSMNPTGQYMFATNNTTGFIYVSANYGLTWGSITSISSTAWRSLSISSTGSYLLASIYGGAVYASSITNTLNMNATVGFNNATPQYTLDVSGTVNASQGLISTGITPSTTVYQQNWTAITSLPTQYILWNSVAISSTGQYMLVGYNTAGYGLYLSTNYGASWSQITNAYTNGNYRGVAISSTGQYMIAANTTASVVYYSDSYGANLSWKQLNLGTNGLPTSGAWIGATISSTGQYMILSQNTTPGNMYISTNFGASWTVITGITSRDNYFCASISATGQYMLISNYALGTYISSNYGSSWTLMGASYGLSVTVSTGHVNNSMSDNGQYMAIASNFSNIIFISNNYGESWTPSIITTDMNSVVVSSTGQFMIASSTTGTGSGVYYSTNYGIAWTKSTSIPTSTQTFMIAMSKDSKYILVSKNVVGYPVYLSVGTPVTTLGLNNPTPQYTLDIANNTNTQQLNTYATAPTNFGGTYSYVADLAAAYTWTSSTVSGNGQYMLVTTAGPGGVWISTTYGTTWSQTTLPSTSAFSWNYGAISSTGNYMLAASSTGSFISLDYGSTWSMIISLSSSVSYYGLSMSSTGQYMLATVNGTIGVYLSTNYGSDSVPPYGGTSWVLTTLPTNYSYLASGMSSNGQYMVVSQYNPAGSLYVSSNYGVTWAQVISGAPTNVSWYQVSMSNSGQYIIAGVIAGYSYVSSNYGASFTQTTLATAGASSNQICSVSGTGQYMFVGNNNGAFYSINYGVTWTQISYLPGSGSWRFSNGFSTTGQYSIQFVCGGNVYVSGGTSVNSVGSNQIANFGAGSSWTNLSSVFSNGSITTCAISGTGQYMIIGTGGSIGCYLSTNYGYSFTQISTAVVPTTGYYYCAAISFTGQYMIVANSSGTALSVIYLSSNYGLSFSSVTMPASDLWQSASISTTGQYMIIGTVSSNKVYISNNYGVTGSWTAVSSTNIPTTYGIPGIAISGNGQYMLAGPGNNTNSSALYLSTNNGTSWNAISLTSPGGWWQAGISTTGQYMIAAGYSGYSYISTTYGSTWNPTPMASTSAFITCNVSSSGQYMYVGNPNGAYFSNNYGTTWSIIPTVPGNANFRNSAMSGSGQYIMSPVYGTAGLCYTSFGAYVNVPATYTPQITNSVTNQAVSQYAPQQNPGSLNINSSSAIVGTNFNYANGWSTVSSLYTGAVWCTFMSSTGQYMIAGHQNAYGLYWSTNYGASWAQYNTATFPTAVWWNGSAFSANSQYILVCGVNGTGAGVYLSSNFGQSFTLISNSILPTGNSFYGCSMSSTGQYMLASCAGANGLYWSTNYGVSWAINNGTNLPTNICSLFPTVSSTGQYMLVATYFPVGGVYVSNTYGTSWTLVTAANGLPTSNGYWQTSMSSTGQYMMVTSGGITPTTGYAYLSSNYGVTWITVPISVASTTGSTYTCAVSGTGQYMFVNCSNGNYYSNNYGVTWNTVGYLLTSGNYRSASMSYNGQYVIAGNANGGSTGVVYVYSVLTVGNNTSALTTGINYGMNPTWNAIANISTSNKEGTAISSTGQYMYTGGSGIGLWWSTDYGVTWKQNTNGVPTNGAIQQIGISSTGQYVLVSVSGSGMYLSSNYGQIFSAIGGTLTNGNYWYAAAVSGTGQYMICGSNNTGQQGLYLSTNYGAAWTAVSTANVPTNNSPISMVISANGQYMLTGGWSNLTSLYLSSNFGATWSSIPASAGVITSSSWYQVGVSSTGQYMIAGSNTGSGLTFISSNYGVSWSALQIGSGWGGNSWAACCISGTGQYMLVQNIAGSFLSNDYGANWITNTVLPVSSAWRQPSMSYTGQYILTQLSSGQVWLSSGITGVGINNSNPQNALDIVGPMKYPTYMASGYLTNSLLTTYGTGLPYTNTPGYPSSLTSAGAYYAPVTGIYNLICNFAFSAATAQTWQIGLYVGTSVPSGINFSSMRTNTNILTISVAENASYTLFTGILRYTGKILAGSYVWVIATNGSNVAITTYSWGNNTGTTTSMSNNFTGYLVSAL